MNELKFETAHRLNKNNLSNNYKMQSQRKPYYVMSKEAKSLHYFKREETFLV